MDCRDDDVKGGNIVGSLHLPDSEFSLESVETILSEIEKRKLSRDVAVVFHCMESARRGPRCARRFHEMLKIWNNHDWNITVRVLTGGFDQWIRTYYDTKWIENYDDEYWGFEETRRIWSEKFHKDYERPEDQPKTPWSDAGSSFNKT